MLTNIIKAKKDQIVDEVKKLHNQGYRFIALTCEKEGDDYEFVYHFDLNYEITNLKILVKPGSTVKSISSVYLASFLIENEIQDLYGLTFEGLSINYGGNLLLLPDGPKTPMA